MKRMDLFCASPASTAICSSMDQRAMVRHGTRPINHRSHQLGDRRKGLTPVPCTSQLPIDPKPYYQRNRRSSAKQSDQLRRKKSSADINDLTSPPGSSRYLLSDSPFFELLSDSDRVKALVPSQNTRPRHLSSTYSPSLKLSSDSDRVKALVPSQNTRPRHVTFTDSQSLNPSSDLDHKLESRRPRLSSTDSPSLKPSSTRSRPCDQVVELRVSIHCKGCEGKIRKHISRMEGVTSFSIDLATKKVTVIGDVTPLGVLTSISRVKNAQFWPSPTSSSSSSSLPMVGLS